MNLRPQIVTIFEVDICGIFLLFFREYSMEKAANHTKERWIMKNLQDEVKEIERQLMQAYLKK
jgi:hypothetical protein